MASINLPGQTIGILGTSAVSQRLQAAALERGYRVVLFSNDHTAHLLDFAGQADVLIFEPGVVETEMLQPLQPYIEIPQLSQTLSVTEDRMIEKVFLESLNINIVPYAMITSREDLEEAIGSIGFPCVLKPIRVEKNQLSNIMLYSEEDFGKTATLLKTGSCILEAWIPFDKELAASFVSGKNGQIIALPISETIYHHHVLRGAATPAQVQTEVEQAVGEIGRIVTEAMGLSGIVTIEFLVTAGGTIYVKRISTGIQPLLAYTLDATNISQYELFIRAVCGLPIPEVTIQEQVTSYFLTPEEKTPLIDQLMIRPDWYLHLADKEWFINAVDIEWTTIEEQLHVDAE